MKGKFFPENKYDVAIIGSGLGSLSAASLLANRGLKVLVAEQHYLPEGCCSIFRRNDFTFDSAVGMDSDLETAVSILVDSFSTRSEKTLR